MKERKKALFVYGPGELFQGGIFFMMAVQSVFQFDIQKKISMSLKNIKKWIQEYELVVISSQLINTAIIKNLEFKPLWLRLLEDTDGRYIVLNVSDHSNREGEKGLETHLVFGDSSSFMNYIYCFVYH